MDKIIKLLATALDPAATDPDPTWTGVAIQLDWRP